MKAHFKNFIIMSLIYGTIMSVFFVAVFGLSLAIILGTISGLIFGGLMILFTIAQEKKFRKNEADLCGNKEVIYSGSANLMRGKVAVGGWLMLLDDSLLFTAHKINHDTRSVSIELLEINNMKLGCSMMVIPNNLIVESSDEEYRFVVNGRSLWFDRIKSQVNIIAVGVN